MMVGLGGFLGANARYLLGLWAHLRWGGDYPVGTFVINVTGSFALGVFATLMIRYAWHEHGRLLIAVGFLGAYTTFSAFGYETLQMLANGRHQSAIAYMVSSVALGLAAVYLGAAAARWLPASLGVRP